MKYSQKLFSLRFIIRDGIKSAFLFSRYSFVVTKHFKVETVLRCIGHFLHTHKPFSEPVLCFFTYIHKLNIEMFFDLYWTVANTVTYFIVQVIRNTWAIWLSTVYVISYHAV